MDSTNHTTPEPLVRPFGLRWILGQGQKPDIKDYMDSDPPKANPF